MKFQGKCIELEAVILRQIKKKFVYCISYVDVNFEFLGMIALLEYP